MSLLHFVFRLVLRGFPGAWRQEYGREMEEIFLHCVQVERRRQRGIRRLVAPWRGIADAVAFGYTLRRRDAPPRVRDASRQRGAVFMIRDDVKSAFRLLRKEPLFAVTLIATLALGIGAATAMVTIANAVLVRALPLPDSDRLYIVRIEPASAPNPDEWFPLSDADFLAWRDQNRAMSALTAWATNDYTLTGRGDPEALQGVQVTSSFFDVVGVRPAVGRPFEPTDTAPAVILSDQLWSRTFARDPAIVGQTATLNGRTATIVGVMPPGFTYPRRLNDIWVHRRFDAPKRRGPFYVTGLGRLREGASVNDVATELERATAAVKTQYGGEMKWHLAFESMKERVVRPARPALYMLLSAVGCLLLIAATNAANLSLVRGIKRHREIAVRTALGAPRWRLARQLVTESVFLAVIAGAAGLAVATGIIRAVRLTAGDVLPRLTEVKIDPAAFAIAVVLALATGLLFGLLPSWVSSRSDPAETLKQLGRSGASGARRSWAQRLVVSLELALAVVLASSGGLMIRSFVNLQRTDVGIRPDHVLTFGFDFPDARYPEGPKREDFYTRLLDGMSHVPGVESASVGISLPPDELSVTDNFTVAGFDVAVGESAPVGPIVIVSDKYFDALGIPLIQGRYFQPTDTATSDKVVIISRTIARQYFPGGDAIGKRFRTGGPERPKNPWMTIVGVVGDVKFDGLDKDASPAYYMPLLQNQWDWMFAALRTTGDPAAVMPGVRAAVRNVDPLLPVRAVKTMHERLAESSARPKFHTMIAAGLGLAGLLLAGFGIYSVVAYQATQRMREFGVRAALGARADHLRALVLREGLLLAGIGTVLGLGGALVSTRLFSALLFDVTPTDPITFVALVVVFALVTIAACLGPARRAARTDPLLALRSE